MLCRLFGHQPEPGYYRDSKGGDCYGYLEVEKYVVDGIGRRHACVYAKCRWCGKRYQVGYIYLNNLDK